MPVTYPPAAPTLSGDTLSISRFLQSPTQLARRLRTLAENRYIADTLLSGRFQVSGGAIVYETGESIFTNDNPRSVAPGGEYPLTTSPTGVASIAKTRKWGQDVPVTDEAITRQLMDPVNRAMTKLVNQNVKFIDSIALSAIATAVTNSASATASWSSATAVQILKDILSAKANILALNQGYTPDTVVLDDLTYANVFGTFLAAGYFARENDNPLASGAFPVVDGLRFLSTPNLPTAGQVLVLDSNLLGGMADENLGGGYVGAGHPGVEGKSIREEKEDRWRLRMRRVTVPVVLEPAAARKITGV